MADYSFVATSTFNPFSLQEYAYPFEKYGEAYEKDSERALELMKNADKFKYLSETLPEGSQARQIYEGYANDLMSYAKDFTENGLTQGNRGNLWSMRGRYSGEIGRLEQADKELQKILDTRYEANLKDPTMMYATENIGIDDVLDRKKPNMYSISGDYLYKRGLEIGASASSRIYSDPKVKQLTKYYQDSIQTQGYSPELLASFQKDMAAIPEVQKQIMSTMKSTGASDNLTGNNYNKALESIFNGVINGAIYKRTDTLERDLSAMTAAEEQAQRNWEKNYRLTLASQGFTEDEKGNLTYNIDNDLGWQRNKAIYDASNGQNSVNHNGQIVDTKKNKKEEVDENGNPVNSVEKRQKNLETAMYKKYGTEFFGHNGGFTIDTEDGSYNYQYAGLISNHGKKWYGYLIGQDNPGHEGWGFASTANTEDSWGTGSMESMDNGKQSHNVKILKKDEEMALKRKDGEAGMNLNATEGALLNQYMDFYGIDRSYAPVISKYTQLVQVPNETGFINSISGKGWNGYAIAVPTELALTLGTRNLKKDGNGKVTGVVPYNYANYQGANKETNK